MSQSTQMLFLHSHLSGGTAGAILAISIAMCPLALKEFVQVSVVTRFWFALAEVGPLLLYFLLRKACVPTRAERH